MDEAEREKLRLTLIGMINSAMNKHPSAPKGEFKDLMNSVVDERFAARKAKEAEEAKKRAHQRRLAAAKKRNEAPKDS